MSAHPAKNLAEKVLQTVRLSGGRSLRLILRPRRRVSRLLALMLSAWVPCALAVDSNALPTQGLVRTGAGQISQSGSAMTINQSSQRLGIDWQSYNIGANASVRYVQPGRDAVALNRIVGNDASQIYGKLSSNGQVFLVNPNGVLFAPGSKVDVGGLVATSLNLSQEEFAKGNYRFSGPDTAGKVVNQGQINAASGGYVALFAPQVKNEGTIHVPAGQVVLAGGRAVTVDVTGSGLISAVVDQGAAGSSVENSGTLSADGGTVRMTAKTAQEAVGGIINNTGIVKASTLVNRNGEIWLAGETVTNTGELRAEGAAGQRGGRIDIQAVAVALGGSLSADGGSQGGQITVEAGQRLSLAENVSAQGQTGHGGEVRYTSGGGILESSTSRTDVSGATDGGSIQVQAASGVASSGEYVAEGATGQGGRVDISGKSVHMLSARVDASGATEGGRIRIGGEFQGGKLPENDLDPQVRHQFIGRWEDTDTLVKAETTFINDGTTLDVSASQGQGGTAIVWSDKTTTFLGRIDARGGSAGGAVEISAGDTLKRAELANVQIGQGGQLLLDPKNLIIGDAEALKQWQYQGVLESIYAWKASVPVLDSDDQLGVSVALNDQATLMAVGAHLDDGAAGSKTNAGAVHLFSFQDTSFGGGALVGSVGNGYLGGKNVDVSTSLDANDYFGVSVALSSDGKLMAVGAHGDDGASNGITDAGAVHLFSFADTQFSGGQKVGTVGSGYVGSGNVSVTLGGSDQFGISVALNGVGTRMAVGAHGDDGSANDKYDAGAVHLFTFGNGFVSGTKVGTIGNDYAGGGDLALAQSNYDNLGVSVALSRDGNYLAVGAHLDDGSGAASSGDYGAVHLFTLDSAFKPSKVGTIGLGYSGTNDVSLSLGADDYFGRGLALNGDGTRLAVGAYYDDGEGNARTNSGAVYLFTFNAGFTNGRLTGTIGAGYEGAHDIDVALDNSDIFGTSLAMSSDATRLAVGAPYDDGANNNLGSSGAVHLFTFADTSFGGGRQVGSVGQDYRNERGEGVSLDGQRSAGTDYAGMAVSLSGNGRLLAVGAPGDDGYGDNASNTGAVHLITFTDASFSGAALVGSIGDGYSGGKNVDVKLDNDDEFGFGVALSRNGQHLAVGARRDDGAGNATTDSGAVHLFTFSDASFGGGQKVGTMGSGYIGDNNVNVSLGTYDYFGAGLALDQTGSRLAVGAYGGDGATYSGDSGAVHLFTFGTGFTGGTKVGTIGNGYTGSGDINVPLDYSDYFGVSLALSTDGKKLAVGAYGDDGVSNTNYDAGAVYLFSFSDTSGAFTGGVLQGKIGAGYVPDSTAGNTASVSLTLGNSDYFGRAVALNADGTLLAAGANYDDGASDGRSNSGAVHLFTFGASGFASGALAGSIGDGYTGGRNIDVRLDGSDIFGTAVALSGDGKSLAVGAPYDDGASANASNSGAVHLFTFDDTAFSGGRLVGHIGNGYQPENSLSLNLFGYKSWNGDQAGAAVALSADAKQLVIGVPYDDGGDEKPWNDRDYGAVHLVTFTDGNFGGGQLVGTIGKGYVGSKDVNLALDADDNFGAAVALSGDGKHLAVGAPNDDGVANGNYNLGAVRLFTFTDTVFANPQLKATLGGGYAGTYDLNLSGVVETYDSYGYFGSAVALNSDGTRLAVGKTGQYYKPAAVHLFTFNSDFSGGVRVGAVGNGYTTTGDPDNVNITSADTSEFGRSVALNASGTLLAIGSPYDGGAANGSYNSGAVYLVAFGAAFTGGTHLGTIGAGYSGSKDVNLTLDSSDYFGQSVALNAAGTQLAVGAYADDGDLNRFGDSGAVHLFSFTDSAFSGGAKVASIGSGYTGGKNVEVGGGNYDYFGWSVALNGDGTRLAVGAPRDDGALNDLSDSGAVHLFSFSDSVFSNGALTGRIGHDRVVEKSLALDVSGSKYWSGEQAGWSVGLSADARQLVIGAPQDTGGSLAAWSGNEYGAVHLVTFSNGDFGGGQLVGTLGKGYTGGKNIDVALDNGDEFGYSVALSGDGKHLAVGARYDDGFNNSDGNSGAVHLFTFSDTTFAGGQKVGTIGSGYAGAGDINFTTPNYGYYLGMAVALDADGSHLAIGDPYSYNSSNGGSSTGAVHLFKFDSASAFANGAYVGTVGAGFSTNASDVNVNASSTVLQSYEYFGWAVALNEDGSKLAVAAPEDDGASGTSYSTGAVHLFSFTPGSAFLGGQRVGTLGKGYTTSLDVDNVDVALDNYDYFGYGGVALSADGSKLVVGTPYDRGFGNTTGYAGAVHTFSFGAGFSSGIQVGSLGKGYAGSNNLNLNLAYGDYFGWSVALNGDGTRLAVGMPYDDGATDAHAESGSVQLFTFGSGLTTPAKVGDIGRGYTGTASLDAPFTGYGSSSADQLGTAVALSADARLLAVGAPGAVGGDAQSPVGNAGAVHLITFADGDFGGAALAGTLGNGYSGGKNVNVSLDSGDQFGSAVALSRDGKTLAVGAPYDDGANNAFSDSGAVRLFTFTDTAFSGGVQQAVLGVGYSGGKNMDATAYVSAGDRFGQSVALNLDGSRLVVGAPYARGSGDSNTYSGEVHLYRFGDATFSAGEKTGTLGHGYSGTGNLAVTLDAYDYFGWSVALSADASSLVVGAIGDDGYNVAYSSYNDFGAVHLFNFIDGNFTTPQKVGTVGSGYVVTGDVALTLDASDQLGRSVALDSNATRLAVGAIYDDGANFSDSGAVHLVSFASALTGGSHVASVGAGYSGGKDVHVSLGSSDYFGSAVALSGDARRMAVGASGDDGIDNSQYDSGAVHLFTFTDTAFSGGQQVGRLGQGYVAVSQALNLPFVGSGSSDGDAFGSSVALSADAKLLAVGLPNDVGNNKGSLLSEQGAVHLITFTDGNYGGAQLAGTIGSGYSGGKNVDVTLDANDHFGTSVALSRDGMTLAVGAPEDDGANNSRTDSGAVHLFTFTDTAFSGGQKAATLGYGYAGGKNLSVALDNGDYFGQSVALNEGGTRLAVGAPYDDGASNNRSNAGAVHLFTFVSGFTSGQKVASIGVGYDVDLTSSLGSSDQFGWSVALSGNAQQLAAGARYDDGNANAYSDVGAVHLFTFGDAFTTGAKTGTVGMGYVGSGDVNVSLGSSDYFGSSVALSRDGTRLVVGAAYDDGAYDTNSSSGAIHLFSFSSAFAAGERTGVIGSDYAGAKDINLAGNYDYLGWSVALNGDASRLVAGLKEDSGVDSSRGSAGAAKLFAFSDGNFTAGRLAGTLGYGYQSAPSTLSLPWTGSVSYAGDAFGSAVAFDATGTLLAVGAPNDDGLGNSNLGSGAVHLFQFSGSGNAQATLLGTMGSGYTGGKNVNVSLDAGDAFGSAIALSANGTRMAVGAKNDDGYGNRVTDSGAVHLFSFSDSAFSGGARTGSIGYGYTGTGNLAVNTLDYVDRFGSAVAFNADGTLLAVGAPLDKGATNGYTSADSGYGAVHLFKLVDNTWSKTGTIGYGYSGSGSLGVSSLANTDNFGTAVSLNADGTQLAAGAPNDDGASNNCYDCGAVHLFTLGTAFSTPVRVGSLGHGYVANLTDTETSNDQHLNLSTTLGNYDYFGHALSLTADGTRLAVGAPYDDGGENTAYDSGAVHVFAFAGTGFATPSALARIGVGYSTVGDLQNKIGTSDYFGSAVAFNADGTRLAVGLPADDGVANSKTASGAVRVFTFADNSYAQGFEIGVLGDGRLPVNLSFPKVSTNDRFGAAVALSDDATRLAVGAPGDDGANNDRGDAGAVHLFSFSDGNFAGATLEGTIGFGYSGGKNVNVDLGWGDNFGAAVAFNDSATRLAVGAPKDDGANNDRVDSGAVHLFAFTDGNFTGGSKVGVLGYGYSGSGRLNVTNLESYDYFGSAVALSDDGTRLVVGAPGDDGYNSYSSYSDGKGAVYRFTFSDGTFAGAAQAGIIGSGYTGSGDVNLALDYYDQFGQSVALNSDATLLAVGTPGDDGYNNASNYYYSSYGSGAVHLFRFADNTFSAPTQVGSIGTGYVGAGDVEHAQDYDNRFGSAVALNDAGTALAVGAPNDDGADNYHYETGTLFLFGFDDVAFGNGHLTNTLGHGYTSVGQVNLSSLSNNDFLGSSVAFNATGDTMVAGLPGRDSTGGYTLADTGGVYLIKAVTPPAVSDLGTLTFTGNATDTQAGSMSGLASTLAAGTDVTLRANNDIMLSSDLIVTGSTGGDLSLIAGRRVLLNGNITTANGDLTVKANAPAADGVVIAERNSGAAAITVSSGKAINAGAGAVSLVLANGAGLNDSTSGHITLGDVSAATITVENLGPTADSDIVLNGQLAATGNIVLATTAGNLSNNKGATALTSSTGRWLVYTGHWGYTEENGLVGAAGSDMPRLYNMTYAGSPPSGIPARNHLIYRSQPTATIYGNDVSKVYGAADPTLTYYASGLVNDDGVADTYATAGFSAPTLTLPTVADPTRRGAGDHVITLAYTQTGSNAGYVVNLDTSATLTVTPKPLTLTGLTVANKVYDGTTSATVTSAGSLVGVLSGDDATVSGSASAAFATARAGNGTTVNVTGFSISGPAAGNYSIGSLTTAANISRKEVSLASFTASNKVYDGSVAATISGFGGLSGLVGTETLTVSGGGASFASKDAGVGKTVSLTGISLNNGSGYASDYILNATLPTATATITPKPISASGSRIYDGTANVQAGSLTLLGTIGGDRVVLGGTGTIADKHVGDDKPLTLGTLALSGNEAGNYALASGIIDITPVQLPVTGMTVQNKVYDGSTVATYSGTPVLSGGVLGTDSATLSVNALTVAFADKHAGFNKSLVASGISLTGADAGNYQVVVGSTASITPRTLSLSASASDKVYDGTRTAAVAVTDNRISRDVFTVNASGLFDSKNVGVDKPVTVSVGLTGTDAGNYAYSPVLATSADITPRTLTFSASAQNKVYDGTRTASLTVSDDRVAGDALSLTASGSFADKNVGTGKVVAVSYALTGADLPNYTYATGTTLSANITPKTLTADGTRVYDGTTAVAAADLSLIGLISGDTVTLAGAGSMADKQVGTNKAVTLGTLALGGTGSGNYLLGTTRIDITPRQLTVSGLTAENKTYDGTKAAVASGTPVLTGSVVAGDTVSVLPTPSITVEFVDKHAGENKSLVVAGGLITGTDAGNYQVVVEGQANIDKRDLNVTATGVDKVYDGSRVATLTTTDNKVADDDLTIAYTATFDTKNVGNGKPIAVSMSLAGSDAGNYNYTPVTSASADITPRALTVTATAANREYNGNTTASLTLSDNRVTGDNLGVGGVGTFSDKNAGNAKQVNVALTYGGTDLGNYSTVSSLATTANITKRNLTFSSLTIADKVYDGTTAGNVTGTFDLSGGLISGDSVSVDAASPAATFADKHAGTNKAVTVSGVTLSGTDAGNYQIQTALGTATIFKKTIDVSGLTPTSKVYDGTTLASTTGVPDVSASFITGDAVAVNVGSFSVNFLDKNVGIDKPLVLTGSVLTGADAGNYSPLLNTRASITPRTLLVTAAGLDKVYDGSTTAQVVISDNRVTGDTLTVTGTGLFGDKNVGASKAVDVTGVAVTGSDAGNYSYTGGSALTTTASITPKTVSASGSREYDGSTSVSAVSFSGLVSGDVLELASGLALVDKNAGLNKAYTGSATLSGTDAGNYLLSGLNYTVLPKSLTVSGLSVADKVYDGTTAATVTGAASSNIGPELVSGDVVTINLSTFSAAYADKNVGDGKAVFLTGSVLSGADAANYRPRLSVSGNITPRQLTVTGVDAEDKVYDGTVDATLKVSGTPSLSGSFVSGDSVSLDLSQLAVAFADKNAGTGKSLVVTGASLSGGDAGNYRVSVQDATADIARKPLTVSVNNATRVYGAADVSFDVLYAGWVSGESPSNSGVTGVPSVTSNATTTSPVGNYTVTPALGTLSATNYSFDVFVPGTLTVTPRPLVVAANNVLRFAGEADPTPFEYSLNQGGLVNGDALGSVSIAMNPGDSASAKGGELFALTPSGAVFTAGSAGNYSLSYAKGYMIVLPKPDEGTTNNGSDSQDLLGAIDTEDIEASEKELSRQQGALLGWLAAPANPVQSVKPSMESVDPEDATRRVEVLLGMSMEEGARALQRLREQPMVIWHPDMPKILLNKVFE
jgi:filamentous hemagglutinin family protein